MRSQKNQYREHDISGLPRIGRIPRAASVADISGRSLRSAILAAALILCLHSSVAQSLRPPPGHTRALAVPVVTSPPIIDGSIDDPAWKSAARATDFWISEYNRVPAEATEAWVLADAAALYIAFKCVDSKPGSIHAEQAARDGNFGYDDQVTVQLDPYHNRRQVSDFSVNALGTQSDAIAGGRARKIEWKGDWQGAARRTSDGWTAEMRIPFAILNYQPGANAFGVNFVRYHHRTQEYSRWADVTPQFLPEESGRLTALKLPNAGSSRKWTLLQYAAAGINSPDKRGDVHHTLGSVGLDLRYDIAHNLSSVLSLNPDFSQVEDDVLGLSFNYNEKFRRDFRPFFQEGSAFFGDRSYFYSTRIPNFDVGFKSFGKTGPVQVGMLALEAPGGRWDYAGRVLRELGPTANLGLTVVGTRRADIENQLGALDFSGRFNRTLNVSAAVAASATGGRPGSGTRVTGSISHETSRWQTGIVLDTTDRHFFPADGFIPDDVPGTRGASVFVGNTGSYAGGPLRSSNVNLSYTLRDTLFDAVQTRNVSLYAGGETRGNIQFNVGTTIGPYRPRRKKTDDWETTLNNDHFYSASVYFDTRSDRHGYGLTYSWGFLGGGAYSDLAPSFWIKPTRRLYLSYGYEVANSFGVTMQHIVSLAWEVSREQSLSFRWVQTEGANVRVAYRRQVRNGLDVFAVLDTNPDSPTRFTLKLVRAGSFH